MESDKIHEAGVGDGIGIECVPGASDGKESATQESPGLIPGSGRSLEKGMATHSVFLPGKFHGKRSLS